LIIVYFIYDRININDWNEYLLTILVNNKMKNEKYNNKYININNFVNDLY
jgi:hypothetical protein